MFNGQRDQRTTAFRGLARRLQGLSWLASLALIGAVAYAYAGLSDVQDRAEVTEDVRVPQLILMNDLELAITQSSLQLRHAMLARNDAERDAALTDIAGKRASIAQAMNRYEQALSSANGRAKFAQIPPVMDDFWTTAERNVALIQSGQREQAFEFLIQETIPARNRVLATVGASVAYQETALAEDIAAIRQDVLLTSSSLSAVVALIVVSLLFFSFWMARSLRRRIALACNTAERVRDGDLATAIEDPIHDEFSPLMIALGDMRHALARVVTEVRSSAESVAAASLQIAQGNQDLSARTEQQASALEETSATAGLLGDTARQNAQHAESASTLAIEARRIAEQGGAAMNHAVQTMGAVNDSSRQISEIIGVIDGIAFQTNILALNAAVEAARAGDQGRGFAVVAAEVRTLAQRSAQAAKDIKLLINTSVKTAEKGTALVSEAGVTVQTVIDSIHRVTDIVADISRASAEQSDGVGQVSEAVRQMDNATQQNSALVEESAAAADRLQQQARQLVGLVSTFRLEPA